MQRAFKIIIIAGLFLSAIIVFLGYNANRELVNAFDKINQKLDSSNANLKIKEDIKYQELDYNSKDSIQINLIDSADKLRYEIELIKEEFLVNLSSYESMDDVEKTNLILFKGDEISTNGINFLNALYQYKQAIIAFSSNIELVGYEDILSMLPADAVESMNWLKDNFRDFPAIATITKLTSLQNDVLSINSKIIHNSLEK